MDQQSLILAGAIGGSALGVLGGLVGTYYSVRNTDGPRERAFVVRSAFVCWMVIAGFLLALWLTPTPFRFLLWVPYAIALPLAIRGWNRKQEKIRREESGDDAGGGGTPTVEP